MSKIIFNEIQMKQLEKNENVVRVSERSITYCADFKIKAVKENQSGKGSAGRPSIKMLSSDDKLKKAEARIAFLEAELAFLKS
ncbi:hypothetical protein [Bacillus sp. XF8]|uniref:hypothetical protein n=1 Tax=Bacillus sp. XF8 TaxID=2819289 RepID=UPI001AA07515|nr:hypothetical protein [Bacillus sp. XF8]MBO1580920.1 hypothetical protein [Bacillus sp. XF8]